MNVLFLDVDGVLNSERSFLAGQQRLREYPDKDDPYFLKITKCTIDPIACDMVNRICRGLDVKVVVSSTHRMHFPDGPNKLDQLKNYFDVLGVKSEYVIGWTPRLNAKRGIEIKLWLEEHPEVKQYVILDDSCDMLPEQMGNFVRCPGETGMTAQNYREVATLFGYKDTGIIGGEYF